MFGPRGVETSPDTAGAAAKCTSSDNLFGRGGYGACPGPPGLRVMAVVSWRLMNSPAAWVFPAAFFVIARSCRGGTVYFSPLEGENEVSLV